MLIKTRHKIALASLAYRVVMVWRRIRGLGTSGVFKRGGLSWALDLGEGIDFSIYLRGSFEPDHTRFFEKKLGVDEVILDIGANIGAHTLHYAKRTSEGHGRVIAVEATAYAFGKMLRNLSLNPAFAAKATPVHCMLVEPGQPVTETEIYSSWPLTGGGDRHAQHQGIGKPIGDAQVTTLDALVRSLALSRIDWIKIDVDGHELQVLRGAVETLRKFRPRIVMELAHDYEDEQQGFKEMVGLLFAQGYRFYSLAGKPLPTTAEGLMAFIPGGASLNALAQVVE
jgi:FkbM family methyltransferase